MKQRRGPDAYEFQDSLPKLSHCQKYWLNVTHPPAFVARFTAQKNRFDAIQPFIPPLPLRSPGAVLCCVFFFSFPKRHKTTENINNVPVGTAVCPLSVLAEDEQRRYSKPSKSERGTKISTGIRKGHKNRKFNHNPPRRWYRYLSRCSERRS